MIVDQKNKDRIFSIKQNSMKQFCFDDNVVQVFPDMIARSVPGYEVIISMIEDITSQYVQSGSNCYDLGCSLGAATISIMHGINKKNCHIYAIDNSIPMIKKCQSYVDLYHSPAKVNLICSDINNIEIKNASVIVLNFTLQFIKPDNRKKIINKIYNGMNKGGILILSEKVIFKDEKQQKLNENLHYSFKSHQGYSNLEISQKRSALENVLISDSIETHEDRILTAGFRTFEMWFKCYNFVSMLAIK